MTEVLPMEMDQNNSVASLNYTDVIANVPQERDRVYKEECLYCFDTPFKKGGIFISTKSFYAVCAKHLSWLVQHEKNNGFVNYVKTKVSKSESEEPKDKIQKLSVPIEDKNETETEAYFFVNSLDINAKSQIPKGSPFYECYNGIVQHRSARLQDQADAGIGWDGAHRVESVAARNLVQIPNPPEIGYSGYRCYEPQCGLKENLWMNLTDGVIMCGRPNVIQKGGDTIVLPGKGHARLHYEITGYPLCVKLGTVSNSDADVYDYQVDDSVIDPLLREHLAHFSLDMDKMEKTEQSTLEMELDMNQKWEWSKCTEDGQSLSPAFGPGLTGIINIGSSCYINSVLQALFITPEFKQVFSDNGINVLKEMPPADIANSLIAQTCKVVHAMDSGDYSTANSDDNGFKPEQFRHVIGLGHPEFSTKRQQDAEEFLRYFLEKLDENVSGEVNPVNTFRFKIENRLLDASSTRVRYTEREELILSLNIPMTHANPDPDCPDRSMVALGDCLDQYFSDETIEGFKSPVTGEHGNAVKRSSMKTFPKFLFVQMKRFTVDQTYSPIKLEVSILVDEIIDLEKYRGKGPQPGEALLPEDVDAEVNSAPSMNREFIEIIMGMGFTENAAKKAIRQTKNSNVEAALDWVLNHATDADLNDDDEPANIKKHFFTGNSKYRLRGIISHVGKNAHMGHYVAHIKHGDTWYLFNDEKVAISAAPPVSLGYLYLLENTDFQDA